MGEVPKMDAETAAALVDPVAYGEWDRILEIFAGLRRDNPVALAEPPGYRPFWAITRHADILRVSKDNKTFLNGVTSPVLSPIMAGCWAASPTRCPI